MTQLLEGRGLSRSFVEAGRPVPVLDAVDLTLLPGERVALAGPSGSGKSVLLDLLAGWATPDAGEVRWLGSAQVPSWSVVGLVPQAMGLLADLTVWHNVLLPVRLADLGNAGSPVAQLESLLTRLRLLHLRDRLPGELSFGEQQRVAVARAVVLNPPLVLADEPTSHQDDASARQVLAVLDEVCERGGAVLLASHDEDVLARSDRVVRLS